MYNLLCQLQLTVSSYVIPFLLLLLLPLKKYALKELSLLLIDAKENLVFVLNVPVCELGTRFNNSFIFILVLDAGELCKRLLPLNIENDGSLLQS